MYDHSTGELDSKVARLPDSFQQPRVMDMVVGQYALVSVGMVWVNEDDEVRIDGSADIETDESASPYESHVYAVMLNQGIVLDFVKQEQDKPIKLDKIALTKLMDDEDFDLSRMIDVVWVVGTEREQDRLHEVYKEQTGRDLYDIPFSADESVIVSEPPSQPKTVAPETVPESAPSKRWPFGRSKGKNTQHTADAGDLALSIEN